MTSITDAHTHVLLPARVMDRVRELFEAELHAGQLAYPDPDPARVLSSLAEDGVERAWSLPYAHRGGSSRRFNAHTAEAAAALTGRHGVDLVAGCTTHPDEDDPAAVVAEALDELGCRVLKLHCSVGRFEVDDERLDEAFGVAEARGVPVVVHAGHAMSGHTARYELAPIARLAERRPELVLVIAHCGAPDVDHALSLVDTHPNVHADLTPVVKDVTQLHREQLLTHADHLLFGSDAPNTGHTAGALRTELEAQDLPDDVLAAILHRNANTLVPPAP